MSCHCGTHFATTSDQIENTSWQSRFSTDLCEKERGQTGVSCWLHDDGIAHSKCWSQLPNQEHQWKVPWGDAGDDANRGISWHLGVHQLSPSSIVIEPPDDSGHVGITGLAHSLAVVESLDDIKESGMLLDQTGNVVHV